MLWYYAINGEQKDPVEEVELRQLFADGIITNESLVWNETLADWQTYEDVLPVSTEELVPVAGQSADAKTVAPSGHEECCSCHQCFLADDMIEYEGKHVCAECKEPFFQRIREGVPMPLDGGGTGQTPNAELMGEAREVLQGQWGLALSFSLLYNVLVQLISYIPYVGSLTQSLVSPALEVGNRTFYLAIVRRQEARIGMMFHGFSRFGTNLWAAILMGLWILLYLLLLIVPGIMKAYSYAMVYYVLADSPELTASEALERSQRMMYGNRMKLLCLGLRFLGWVLLGILTVFIGLLWVIPYMETSYAKFYDDVRGSTEED